MPYAVSLWFGEAAEAHLRSLWAHLAEVGVANSYAEGLVRPHVTLSHAAQLDLTQFKAALKPLVSAHPTVKVVFSGLGLFLNRPNTLYLSVVFTSALAALQQDIFELVSQHGTLSSPYYRPDAWTPHCTLALNLSPEATLEAVRVAQTFELPFQTTATRVGLIENPSERELRAFALGAP